MTTAYFSEQKEYKKINAILTNDFEMKNVKSFN